MNAGKIDLMEEYQKLANQHVRATERLRAIKYMVRKMKREIKDYGKVQDETLNDLIKVTEGAGIVKQFRNIQLRDER